MRVPVLMARPGDTGARLNQLESLMFLVSGIGHDFNSMITAILAAIEAARNSPDPVRRQALQEAEDSAWRARELALQLVEFPKVQSSRRETLDLALLIAEAIRFACRGGGVRSEERIADGLWRVVGDRLQIKQVLHNLVINARQAMPDGGTITVEVNNASIAEREVAALEKGRYVRISVRDQGAGIPPENIPRVFEPYFTTRRGGSGLGLAVAGVIVEAHSGAITVDSIPGKGATFSVYLPATKA